MRKNMIVSLAVLSVFSASLLFTAGYVSAATTAPRKVTPTKATTNSRDPAALGLSKEDTKDYTLYYHKDYIKDKAQTGFQTFYRNPKKNELGFYNYVALKTRPISKPMGRPTPEECKKIEAGLRADIEASLKSIKSSGASTKVTVVDSRPFTKDLGTGKNRKTFYGCNTEYQIQIGVVSIFTRSRIMVKKDGKQLYLVIGTYGFDSKYEEVEKINYTLDNLDIK